MKRRILSDHTAIYVSIDTYEQVAVSRIFCKWSQPSRRKDQLTAELQRECIKENEKPMLGAAGGCMHCDLV